MESFADYTDVQSIWRTLTDAEVLVVSARIAEASQMVRDQVPLVDGLDVDERINAGSLSAETVKNVVVAMVERVVIPGRFVRQESVSVDDGMRSRTIDSAVSLGEMFISARELGRLAGSRGRTTQVAFMVNPSSSAWT